MRGGLKLRLDELPRPVIAGALIGAPPLHLASAARQAASGGVDVLHLDIMDGHLTRQISFGAGVVRALSAELDVPLDVHLLTSQPDRQAMEFIEAGADILSFQVEFSADASTLLRRIRTEGAAAGLAVAPETSLLDVAPLIGDLDMLIVMTVEPGTSILVDGWADKLRQARLLCDRCERPPRLAVDGGVTLANVDEFTSAGADWLVSASALFRDRRGIAAACSAMREFASHGRESAPCPTV